MGWGNILILSVFATYSRFTLKRGLTVENEDATVKGPIYIDIELDLGVHMIGNFWWKIDKVINSLKTRSLIMSFPHAYMLHRGAVIIRYEIVLGGALYTKEFWRCFWNSFFCCLVQKFLS